MTACQHLTVDGDLVVDPVPGQLLHLARRLVSLSLSCGQCGEPFRFLGVAPGGGCPHEPTVDEGAVELHLAVAPASVLDLDEQPRCPTHGSPS